MDDARIRLLTEEVLGQIGGAAGGPAAPGLESRVAALESVVARLQAASPPLPPGPETHVHGHAHPSLQPLGVGSGSDRCVVEPDKPCVQSGQCRALGH